MTGQIKTPEKLYRDVTVLLDRDVISQRAGGDVAGADARIPIAISSETPVARRDFWSGDTYNEVLDHSPGAVDLSYARDGLAFLDGHDTGAQLGIVEDVTIGADRLLRGMVRFSARPEAQALRQDMLDGIRKKISVGYRQLETVVTSAQDSNGPDEVRVTRWLPMEASSVSIPADYSVGVGRSADDGNRNALHRAAGPGTSETQSRHSNQPSAPKAKEHTVSSNNTADPTGAATNDQANVPDQRHEHRQIRLGAAAEERQRLADIDAVCQEHGVEQSVRSDLVSSGATIAEANRRVLDIVRSRMAKPIPAGTGIELSDKEQKQYSFARAIAGSLEGTPAQFRGVDDGFEREIAQEVEKKLPEQYKRRGGVLIPTVMHTRAGLDSATATKGQETKFTQPGEFIDLLRARMKTRALGARLLSGLTGPVSMVKQTGAAAGSWVGENPLADVAESNLLLGLVTLAIKTYQASTSFSRQLLVSALSGSIDAEQMVREDLALIHALAFDAAAISGTGTANQPRGVLSTAGIGAVAGGVNGAAPTYQNIVDLETAVASANADVATMGYLTTPAMRGKLKLTQTFPASANGQSVWQGQNQLNGYTAEVSTQVPSNLVKGTSTNAHAIIFGDWSQMVFGEWGAIELITDPYKLKKQGMIEVTSFQMGDVVIRTPQSLAAMQDALAA